MSSALQLSFSSCRSASVTLWEYLPALIGMTLRILLNPIYVLEDSIKSPQSLLVSTQSTSQIPHGIASIAFKTFAIVSSTVQVTHSISRNASSILWLSSFAPKAIRRLPVESYSWYSSSLWRSGRLLRECNNVTSSRFSIFRRTDNNGQAKKKEIGRSQDQKRE